MIFKENLGSYFHLLNGKYKRLTRQFEADLPEFHSQDEAFHFFKRLFGEDIKLSDIDLVDGQKLYHYTLVVNRPAYETGIQDLEKQGYSTGVDFMMATHEIQIYENGRLHITF